MYFAATYDDKHSQYYGLRKRVIFPKLLALFIVCFDTDNDDDDVGGSHGSINTGEIQFSL